MRHIFLIIVCYLGFSSLVAQNYFPFPDSNAIWHVVNSFKEGGPTKYTYEIKGDTLMNGYVYNKLVNPYNNFFYGGIRKDTLRRVYFFGNLTDATFVNYNFYNEYDTIKEYLLYQFGLDVGDTVPLFKVSPTENPRIISSIDSIKIDGEYRLRYLVSDLPYVLQNDYWIEGIGSEAGLFGHYSFEFENHIRLTCFQQNGKFIWPDTTGDCLTVSVENIEINKIIKVYPNPASSTWHIQCEKNALLEIYSLSGKEMLRRNIQPGTEQINISQFAEGIYFYKISSKKGKLVKSGELVKN